ncbi:MAG: hypothetical protein QF464_12915, partial [Myxococcota bacterium]|nr:hypothetical protein [Myxococcota bacterium]
MWALGIVVLLVPSASSEALKPPVTEVTWVMPPGQEAVLRKALDPPGARKWLVLQTATADSDKVVVRFGRTRDGEPALAVTLVHPSSASAGATTLEHVAIEPTPGPVTERDMAVLVKRLTAAGATLGVWKRIEPEPVEPAHSPEPPEEAAVEAEAAAVQAQLTKIRALLARGNDAEVVAALQALDPAKIPNGGVRLEIALTYARVGDEEAMKAVSRTFSEDPARGEEALFGPALRGELPGPEALFGGKSDEAICLLHRIGEILGQAGRTDQAGALLGAILDRVPTCARAAEAWALLLLQQREGAQAIAVLRPHHEANPTDVRLIQTLSHAYRMTGDLVEAIRLFHLTADTMAEDTEN